MKKECPICGKEPKGNRKYCTELCSYKAVLKQNTEWTRQRNKRAKEQRNKIK